MASRWTPKSLENLPAVSSEAEDPGYKIDPSRIVDLLPKLQPIEQQLVDMVLFQGLTQEDAGERVGISQTAVSCRLGKCIAMLRYWLSLPALGTVDEIRQDLKRKRLRPVDVEFMLAIIQGATYSAAGRHVGQRHRTYGARRVTRLRRKKLPEKYLAYLTPRPHWPSSVLTREARKRKRLTTNI